MALVPLATLLAWGTPLWRSPKRAEDRGRTTRPFVGLGAIACVVVKDTAGKEREREQRPAVSRGYGKNARYSCNLAWTKKEKTRFVVSATVLH
jgi:hypothetical protein